MYEANIFMFLRPVLAVSFCCFLSLAGAQITDPSEVSALQAIRMSLIDPLQNLNWNNGDPCTSQWKGVFCFNTAENDGYLHVQKLQLLKMNLSGSLSPELGQLSHTEILDFMWNNISGGIPKEIGNIISLKLLLLNGNQLSGSLPAELGYLPNLNRLQIDENFISGALPKSFANLNRMKHLHMNNNSISGQIPPELSRLPNLLHFLLDNNNLSGYLPPELSGLPKLQILQLDNNNFNGSSIPASYSSMVSLLKLSLRNCNLKGAIPDISGMPRLTYLDLSWNQLNGSIPANRLSSNITTIDLSYNMLSGPIPSNFIGLSFLQRLSLENNSLIGFVPSTIWNNMTFSVNSTLLLDFQNNSLSNISSVLSPPINVTIMLQGNPICDNPNQFNIGQFCGSRTKKLVPVSSRTYASGCPPQSCPKEDFFEYIPSSPIPCVCAAPLRVGYRLKSPGFSYFPPYYDDFEMYLALDLNIFRYQLYIDSFAWEEGPRLRMYLKIFPSDSQEFNLSEIQRIRDMFAGWNIHNREIFGPYELLNFTLLGPYSNVNLESASGLSKAALIGILLGASFGAVALSVVISVLIMRRHTKYHHIVSKRRPLSMSIKIDGVRGFTYDEMALATNNFSNSTQVGEGGYGRVYKGILADGTVVAIKRAQEGSLQGSKEFFTEIEFLSRLHHRNLVSLIGYCNEEAEQMLVYEFMSNGTLRDHLSVRSKEPLNFSMRLRIALGSARGILYLHTEADPPIFHRDIKASNILLDSRFVVKVADFGLSRLAPVPDAEGIVLGYISTVVKGTPGYLDPEYFLTHKMTDKSDVYSLGVVFLELLTGMQPIQHGKNIVREVNGAYRSGTIFSITDNRMGSYPSECIEKFVSLALRCCNEKTDLRPSISEVVWELEGICCMTPETDVAPSQSMGTDSRKASKSPSLPSIDVSPYASSSVSGVDNHSSIISTIAPR